MGTVWRVIGTDESSMEYFFFFFTGTKFIQNSRAVKSNFAALALLLWETALSVLLRFMLISKRNTGHCPWTGLWSLISSTLSYGRWPIVSLHLKPATIRCVTVPGHSWNLLRHIPSLLCLFPTFLPYFSVPLSFGFLLSLFLSKPKDLRHLGQTTSYCQGSQVKEITMNYTCASDRGDTKFIQNYVG
jgi:hypothetical protein